MYYKHELKKGVWVHGVIAALIAVLIVSMVPLFPNAQSKVFAQDSKLTTETPIVLVTGTGVIGGNAYTKANMGLEKSYTLDELKAIANADTTPGKPANNQYLYSALNTSETKSIYRAEGVDLKAVFAKSNVNHFADKKVTIKDEGTYKTYFDPAKTTVGIAAGAGTTQGLDANRYYYPKFADANAPSEDGATAVPTIIAWSMGGDRGSVTPPTQVKPLTKGPVRLVSGQLATNDYNNPVWNEPRKNLTAMVGDAIEETVLMIDGKSYSRSDILLMDRAESAYSYTTQNGAKTVYAKGVPISVLLADYDETDIVCFETSDNRDVEEKTIKELKDENYMLAYEKKGTEEDAFEALDLSKDGYTALYGDDVQPTKMIKSITVKKDPTIAMQERLKTKVKISSISATYNTATIKWNKVEGVSGYVIEQSTKQTTGFKRIAFTKTDAQLSATIENLKTGTKYYYRVRAYGTVEGNTLNGKYSEIKSVKPALKKPAIKVTAGKKKATIKWGKISGANGYVVYRATSKSGKYKAVTTIKSGSKISYTNKNLKKGKQYFYKVRAYRTVSGKKVYSSYSAYKAVRVK